jgi:hypothetical protein
MAELTVPLLNVVVPVYNRAQTLERCLSAVCAQLGSSDEVADRATRPKARTLVS